MFRKSHCPRHLESKLVNLLVFIVTLLQEFHHLETIIKTLCAMKWVENANTEVRCRARKDEVID